MCVGTRLLQEPLEELSRCPAGAKFTKRFSRAFGTFVFPALSTCDAAAGGLFLSRCEARWTRTGREAKRGLVDVEGGCGGWYPGVTGSGESKPQCLRRDISTAGAAGSLEFS